MKLIMERVICWRILRARLVARGAASWRDGGERSRWRWPERRLKRCTALSRSRAGAGPPGVAGGVVPLGCREKPSFFARGAQAWRASSGGARRCVGRAMACGALAALGGRPRPGKEPTIALEAEAWLVSSACGKAKGARLSAWAVERRGFWPASARARPPAGGGSPMSRPSGSRHRVQLLGQEEIKPHKVRYYLERRDAESSPRWRKFCVSTARSRS